MTKFNLSSLASNPFKTGFQILLVFFFFAIFLNSAHAANGGLPGTGDLNWDPASDTEDNSCLSPFVPNFDLNADYWYDVSEQILGPFFCAKGSPPRFQANSGEFIVAPLRITLDPEVDPNLILSKVVSIKVIIDGKKPYVYPAEDIAKLLVTDDPPPITSGIPQLFFLPRIRPQSVGWHTLQYYIIVSDVICDFVFSNVCYLPGVDNVFSTGGFDFEVVPGAAQSD